MDPALSPAAREVAAAERKALRRSRVQLASGGRCEHAEHALSDQLDGVATAAQERFLAAHLARCPRCRRHVEELAAARRPAPARPQLRAVPSPLLLEPAPRVHTELALVEEPVLVTASTPPQPIARPDRDVPDRPDPVPARVAVRRNQKNPAIPVLVGALLVAALIVVAVVLLMHFNNPHSHAHAPWSNPGAPNVHPSPLSDQ